MSSKPIDPKHLTRRDFVKVLGVSAGLASVASLTGCKNPLWQRQPIIPVETWHKGVCRFCGTGCGNMIGIRDGKVVDVKGDEYAHNHGRLCIKGLMNREILYGEGRALYPLIRKIGKLERATWDEAFRRLLAEAGRAVEDTT